MPETRRQFLQGGAVLSAGALFFALRPGAQQPHRGMPDPPQPAGPSETEQPVTAPKFDPRLIMEEHEKNFRKKLEEIYEKVRELKKEADDTPTAEIFSVRICKETKEIESLAKQLKKLAKS